MLQHIDKLDPCNNETIRAKSTIRNLFYEVEQDMATLAGMLEPEQRKRRSKWGEEVVERRAHQLEGFREEIELLTAERKKKVKETSSNLALGSPLDLSSDAFLGFLFFSLFFS